MAVAILANGRVLREVKDTVYLPYNCEFTIRFKNMNSLRALVRVSVDGQDATEGTSLIVPANGTVDLERFLKAGNLTEGHRFKFIERTAKIEDGPRGIKVEDGLIRVEFEFERQPAKIENIYKNYDTDYKPRPIYDPWRGSARPYGDLWCSSAASLGDLCDTQMASAQGASSVPTKFSKSFRSIGSTTTASASVPADAGVGITVPGSVSDQSFKVGAWFPTDGQKHAMVLKLMGTYGEVTVEEPVTVKTKIECPTCGTKNAVGARFCSDCGTSLVTL